MGFTNSLIASRRPSRLPKLGSIASAINHVAMVLTNELECLLHFSRAPMTKYPIPVLIDERHSR
jgi:hypothetical protein